MAIKIKPKAKLVSVGKAKAVSTAKAKAVKPGKNTERRGLPKGSTFLYKNEPKQKAD